MKKNLSPADRIIRVFVAAVMAVLLITNTVTGAGSIALMASGVYLLVTGVINFCLVYYLLGISTFGKEEEVI
jgi:hypothetical protein